MRRVLGEKWTEQEAAALVVDYLTGLGLDVYQEVALAGYGGVVADIVALRGREVWIVEVKTTWSLDLLDQLREHKFRCHGHRIFAAVPFSRNDHARERLFKDLGFGSICIRKSSPGEDWAKKTEVSVMAPRVTSQPLPKMIGLLDEGHKTHAKAGAPCAAGRYTPFRKTCEALAEVVGKAPGLSMKDALKRMEHHYSSDACARVSLLKWVELGKVPAVELVRNGKLLSLYPRGQAPNTEVHP